MVQQQTEQNLFLQLMNLQQKLQSQIQSKLDIHSLSGQQQKMAVTQLLTQQAILLQA